MTKMPWNRFWGSIKKMSNTEESNYVSRVTIVAMCVSKQF